MKSVLIVLLLLCALSGSTLAQQCGPSCPVCSGAGSNPGALLPQKSITFSALSIPAADEERLVFNTKVGLLSWLDAGVGYAGRTEEVLWSARVQPLVEQKNGWRPGLILGSGSVQTGGSDQSAYAQLLKSWEPGDALSFLFSGGAAALMPDFDKLYGLAGITASFRKRYAGATGPYRVPPGAVFGNYDGESFHEGISWTPTDLATVSLMLIESEFPAMSVTFRVE